MSRLVIPLFLLLLLAPMASAAYSVKAPGFIYEVKYKVLSNGNEALIPLSVIQLGVTCGMMDCWAEMHEDEEYLLLFSGSQLYLLNFTPVLLSVLPPYAPRNVSWVDFNGVKYMNGSWYVNVSFLAYSSEAHDGYKLNYVLRLDTKRFCAEKTNVNWSQIKGSTLTDEIRDWKIEIPRTFLLSLKNNSAVQSGYPSADVLIVVNASNTKWLPRHFLIVNQTQFPVYFMLKKDHQVKNITLLFLNTTPVRMRYGYYNAKTTGIPGYWFPESIKIVNVASCKLLANETPTTATTPTGHQNKSICGPGIIVALALLPIMRRRREGKEI